MPLKKELVGILHVATCTGTAVHVAFSLAERESLARSLYYRTYVHVARVRRPDQEPTARPSPARQPCRRCDDAMPLWRHAMPQAASMLP